MVTVRITTIRIRVIVMDVVRDDNTHKNIHTIFTTQCNVPKHSQMFKIDIIIYIFFFLVFTRQDNCKHAKNRIVILS